MDKNVRPDGRQLQQRREAAMQTDVFGSALGSASLRFGRSSVVAGVRAQVTELNSEQES